MNWVTRLTVLLFFIGTTFAYSVTFAQNDAFPANYMVAGVADTLIVVLLGYFGNNTITRDCQVIGLFIVFNHAHGFVSHILDLDMNLYANMQILLIIAQYSRLFWQGSQDENINNDFRLDRLCNVNAGLH